MLGSSLELSKLHIGACVTLWRIWHPREVHDRGNKVFCHRSLGRTRMGTHLVPSLYLVVGLAKHAASMRRECGGSLPGVMVPKLLAGFQPGAFVPACRSLVDSGRFLAHGDGPSSPWRHGVYVGQPLRLVAAAAFLFPHRPAD